MPELSPPSWAATSGLPELDAVLGGVYWGDNVVWEPDGSSSVEPFYRAVSHDTEGYHYAGYITLDRSPESIRELYPALEVIDARPGAEFARPTDLLAAIRQRCRRFERDLLLFDSLEGMAAAWGADVARRFYTRCCPLLLDLGAVAYWSMGRRLPAAVRRGVESVAQCVISVTPDRVRIAKAEGRPPRVEGTVLRYQLEDGVPVLKDAPMITRLGAALRSVRSERGLTQTELAQLAGISPSAVSQAELGRRGLAFETLLDLTAKLGISMDDLIRGQTRPGYRLARRHDPTRRGDNRPLPLLDDPGSGFARTSSGCSPPSREARTSPTPASRWWRSRPAWSRWR